MAKKTTAAAPAAAEAPAAVTPAATDAAQPGAPAAADASAGAEAPVAQEVSSAPADQEPAVTDTVVDAVDLSGAAVTITALDDVGDQGDAAVGELVIATSDAANLASRTELADHAEVLILVDHFIASRPVRCGSVVKLAAVDIDSLVLGGIADPSEAAVAAALAQPGAFVLDLTGA